MAGFAAPELRKFFSGGDRPHSSVVQPWVAARCTWKQQSVLLAAVRGCDGVRKEDISKQLTRSVRHCVLNNSDPEDKVFSGFFLTKSVIHSFCKDCDHYPVHFIMHLTHAVEIIGFKHPDAKMREIFELCYRSLVSSLHLKPEIEAELDVRLADGTDTYIDEAFTPEELEIFVGTGFPNKNILMMALFKTLEQTRSRALIDTANALITMAITHDRPTLSENYRVMDTAAKQRSYRAYNG